MAWFLIILCDALPYFTCGHPHDRVFIGVVVAWSREHIDPKSPLFHSLCLSRQRLLDDKPQERRIPLAIAKVLAADDSLELLEKI